MKGTPSRLKTRPPSVSVTLHTLRDCLPSSAMILIAQCEGRFLREKLPHHGRTETLGFCRKDTVTVPLLVWKSGRDRSRRTILFPDWSEKGDRAGCGFIDTAKRGQRPIRKWGQGANLDRMQGADFEEAGVASAGGEAGAGTLGEDREFHHGRVVFLAATVWQGVR